MQKSMQKYNFEFYKLNLKEKDLVKKKKTNDSKTTLEIDGENRLSFGLEKQHTEQHSKVEQWLSKTINQMPEKQAVGIFLYFLIIYC